MTPPLAPPKKEPDPMVRMSFRIKGVNTKKLLKRIKEEGENVWYDER